MERQWYDADGTWRMSRESKKKRGNVMMMRLTHTGLDTRTRLTKITEFWNNFEEVALHQLREGRQSGHDKEQKLLVESKVGEHGYHELEGKEISTEKDVLEDDEHDKRGP